MELFDPSGVAGGRDPVPRFDQTQADHMGYRLPNAPAGALGPGDHGVECASGPIHRHPGGARGCGLASSKSMVRVSASRLPRLAAARRRTRCRAAYQCDLQTRHPVGVADAQHLLGGSTKDAQRGASPHSPRAASAPAASRSYSVHKQLNVLGEPWGRPAVGGEVDEPPGLPKIGDAVGGGALIDSSTVTVWPCCTGAPVVGSVPTGRPAGSQLICLP